MFAEKGVVGLSFCGDPNTVSIFGVIAFLGRERAIEGDVGWLVKTIVVFEMSGGRGSKDSNDGSGPEFSPQVADDNLTFISVNENTVNIELLGRFAAEAGAGDLIVVVDETLDLRKGLLALFDFEFGLQVMKIGVAVGEVTQVGLAA